MEKNSLKVFLIGFIGGILGSSLVFLAGVDLFGSIGLIEMNSQSKLSENKIIISEPPPVNPGRIERTVFETSANSVGIQVFKDGKLVNQGNGVIISSDGLISTIADLVVSGGIYQIFYEDKIVRGTIVAQNFKSNLLILKTFEAYSNVVNFSFGDGYQSGREILLVGRVINLGKPSVFSQKGIISYITDKTVILDATANNYLKGAAAVDMSGRFLGLVYLRSGKLNLVKPELIKSFFDSYINKNKQD